MNGDELVTTITLQGFKIEIYYESDERYYAVDQATGKEVGYLALQEVELEYPNKNFFRATNIEVEKSYRKMGIATELHLAAIDKIEEYSLPAFDVSDAVGMKPDGKALYESLKNKGLLTNNQKDQMENYNCS